MKTTFLKKTLTVTITAAMISGSIFAQNPQVDKKIPKYMKTTGISGNLNSIGSDSMINLMTLWAEGFQKHYPQVKIQIEGKGSSTAPPALIEGTAQLGPMSRKMKSTEIDKFEDKYGFKPTTFGVALDALSVFVNKNNPLEKITLDQVDAIFSKTRKREYREDITTWGQLGLTGEWANKPISIYGRNSASGTYGFFKDEALKKGDYKNLVKEQPGSAAVVQGISEDKFAIGYSGIGYKTSSVKALSLSEDGKTYYEANDDHIKDGHYPLARFLNISIVKDPSKPINPLVREFIKYIFSYEGQMVVVKDGYMPLTAEQVKKELEKLQ